jgi:hypothetical protein
MLAALAITIGRFGTRNPGSTMFALALAFAATNDSLGGARSLAGPNWRPVFQLASFVTGALGAGAFVRASQLFPKRLTHVELSSSNSPLPGNVVVQRAIAVLLRPASSWILGVMWATLAAAVQNAIPSLLVVVIGWIFYFIQWRIGSKIARRRLAWIMQAVLVFGILFVVNALMDAAAVAHSHEFHWWKAIVQNLLAGFFGTGCLAMAVFAAGAFNSALIVRATVASAVVVAAVLFVINVLTTAFVDQLSEWMGLSDRLLVATLGTTAGLALTPFANWFREWATRKKTPAREQ